MLGLTGMVCLREWFVWEVIFVGSDFCMGSDFCNALWPKVAEAGFLESRCC